MTAMPIDIINNTFYGRTNNCVEMSLPGSTDHGIDIRNNIFFHCNCVIETDEYSADFDIYYNDLWNNSANYCGDGNLVENDGLNVDPRFLDFLSFKLSPDSPCIDAGDPAILDIDGSRSDMGAYGGS